jgi:hypothetical protein
MPAMRKNPVTRGDSAAQGKNLRRRRGTAPPGTWSCGSGTATRCTARPTRTRCGLLQSLTTAGWLRRSCAIWVFGAAGLSCAGAGALRLMVPVKRDSWRRGPHARFSGSRSKFLGVPVAPGAFRLSRGIIVPQTKWNGPRISRIPQMKIRRCGLRFHP